MKEILLFVEDPGAVNMILDLPRQSKFKNISFDILATNYAVQILIQNNIEFTQIDNLIELNKYLKDKNYHSFLVGTSENKESLSLKIIDIARAQKILSIGIVDMLSNANFRFSGLTNNPLNHKPDKLIVTDSQTAKKFISLGIEEKDIFLCQHPQEERIKSKKEILINSYKPIKKTSKRWLFVAENIDLLNPSESYYSDEYGFKGRGDCNWRTGIILEEIIDCIKGMHFKPNIVVRLHPKNKIEQFSLWEDEVEFDTIADPIESLWNSDVVLGMSSNLLVEAIILGKPVLSILPRLKEVSWMSELENKIIKSVFCKNDLENVFNLFSKENYILHKTNLSQSNRNRIVDIICEVVM